MRLILFLLLVAGCKGGGDDPDAQPQIDANPFRACTQTPVNLDLEPWREATYDWLVGLGQDVSTQPQLSASVSFFGLEFVSNQPQPGPAALSWFSLIPNLPFPSSEIAISEVQLSGEHALVRLSRENHNGAPLHFEQHLAEVLLVSDFGTWTIFGFHVWAAPMLADERAIQAMTGCTRAGGPSLDKASSFRFTGKFLDDCAETGSYSYDGTPTDTVMVTRPPLWQTRGGYWRSTVGAIYVVDADNYWPGAETSDAYCNGNLGYELTLDAYFGDIISVAPGLNCVGC